MELPVTRYYGSKRKLVERIWNSLQEKHIEFDSFLDIFGGTGIMSYHMANHGKAVIYNDIFTFNCKIAEALLATPRGTLLCEDALRLLRRDENREYHQYIEDIYSGIYYTNEENRTIDTVVQNIMHLPPQQQASAYYVLFQSCLIKRPFNIFHRRNLYLRENHMESNFGNYVTWEKSFESLFKQFADELNKFQFQTHHNVTIVNNSALECPNEADVVYIDTPYFNKKSGGVSYHSRYHFLEGLVYYEDIPAKVNYNKANREIEIHKSAEFETRGNYMKELDDLLGHYPHSTILLSYTSEGYPTIEELEVLLKRHKNHIETIYFGKYNFALNRSNQNRQEVLLIAY
jgi:adenine-specific DNA-methyltransferase